MPIQAIPLALVASLYPFGMAMLLLLFGASRPKIRSAVFVVGAAACTLTIGFIVVFALQGAGLGSSSAQVPRYGLRLAIGVAFVVLALFLARRPPKTSTGGSRISRAATESGLAAAFLAGLALYTPSPSYLSALQVVGSTKLSTAAAAVWVVVVVVLVLITIEVPLLLYLFAPGWTIPKLAAANAWLARNAHALLVGVLAMLGVWEIIDGLIGLL